MIIEHSFVTTHDARDAFALATDLLTRRGFSLQDALPGKATQWRRGKASAATARHTLKVPQNIRMNFDRHRITLATSIDAFGRFKKNGKKLMIAYAESLEKLLADHQMPEAAMAGTDQLEQDINRRENIRRAVVYSMMGVAALGLISLVVVIAIAAQRDLSERKEAASRRVAPSNSTRYQWNSPRPAGASTNKTPPQITVRKAPAPKAAHPQD